MANPAGWSACVSGRLLALECSTERLSVALLVDGSVLEQRAPAAREHARLLLPYAQALLAEAGTTLAGLDGVAFGAGPGSFTGLRIAAAAAQGLAFGADLPVVPVSTLAALAHGANRVHGARRVLPALDARMQQAYHGAFDCAPGHARPLMSEQVCDPAAAPMPEGDGWFAAGPAWQVYASALLPRFAALLCGSDPALLPQARDVAALGVGMLAAGGGQDPALALPRYLRDDVIQVKASPA